MKVTAAIMAAWALHEGFSAYPIIPTKDDVPTIGEGSTFYPDGTRVKMTDPPISRKRAREISTALIEKTFAECVRNSLGDTPITEVEFAQAVDFAGNFGCGNWVKSSMLKKTRTGDYVGACHSYLLYKKAAGFDCSTPGNQRCSGVWTRQLERHALCMSEQAPASLLEAAPAVIVKPPPAPPPAVAVPPPKRWWSLWK